MSRFCDVNDPLTNCDRKIIWIPAGPDPIKVFSASIDAILKFQPIRES